MTQTIRLDAYIGPSPFERGRKLYGRDTETRELVDLLLTERVLLLHSPSGAGKTSLIQAKLVPAMEEEGFTVLGPVRVNHQPLAATREKAPRLNRYTLSAVAGLSGIPEDQLNQEKELELAGLPLGDCLKARLDALDPGQNLLVIFDQFEEALTVDPFQVAEKEAFFGELGKALANRRVWVLFAMREDYMGGLAAYLPYLPGRMRSRYRLDLLREQAARDAISKPAQDAGGVFDPKAVSNLVENLRAVIVRQGSQKRVSAAGPYIEPILLQVVCQWLWNRKTRDPNLPGYGEVTLADIEAVNIDEALVEYYCRVVQEAAREGQVSERSVREWIASELITPFGTRGQASLESLDDYGLNEKAANQLDRGYLIRKDTRMGRTWFELTHDRLVDPIVQNNPRWMEMNLQPFQVQAIRWLGAGKNDEMLLSAADHIQASNWMRAHPGETSALDKKFIQASYQYIQQARLRAANLHTNLEDLGWGVIFHAEAGPEVREALSELLELRHEQAGARHEQFYHEFTGKEGYRPGENARAFLTRHGVGWSQAEPDKMPYYLLIVGSPEQIPFEFQYGLDVQYATGRIYFEKIEEYRSYAHSVVMCERGQVTLPRSALLFAPRFEGMDQANKMLQNELMEPVHDNLSSLFRQWEITRTPPEQARRAALMEILNGPRAPAFNMFAGYAVNFQPGSPNAHLQPTDEGAIVCSDWPGVKSRQQAKREHYFAAADVSDQAQLLGSVFFLLSGYTAGTPKKEDFHRQAFRDAPRELAPQSFLAALPLRLLGHPNGGALGVIGHVENLWGYSWMAGRAGRDIAVMEGVLQRILLGDTLGAALDLINQRYAVMAAALSEMIIQKETNPEAVDDLDLAGAYTATLDARNYIIIGDPAVHLPIARETAAPERPAFSLPQAGPRITFSGVDFTTGGYAFPEMPLEQAFTAVSGGYAAASRRTKAGKTPARKKGA